MARALTLAVASLALVAGVRAQCDNFDDGDDAEWTRYDPISTFMGGILGPQNTWSFTNGAYRIQAKPTPNPGLGPGRAASLRTDVIYTNFYITVDAVDWDETVPQAFGIVASVRELGLGSTDGYAFTYRVDRQTVYITRFTDENPFGGNIGGGVGSYMMVKGRTYRFVFKRVGSELRGEMYELPELTVPVLSAFASDTTYPSGFNGLLVYDYSQATNQSADVSFDNYCAMQTEPVRLSISRNGFGDITISWPVSFTDYILESSPVLSGTTWTQEPHSSNDSVHYIIAYAGDGMRFYRLRKELSPVAP